MAKGILGKKLGMTQIFSDEGTVVPVTVIEAGPCYVVQKKTIEQDTYEAVQLGFGQKRERLVNQPLKGHYEKAGVKPGRYLREFAVASDDALAQAEVGTELKADVFSEGDKVDVTGVTKGKGFQGVIKRHGFHRGPMTHGSHYHRGPGALGSVDPARVFKGRPLPGRMGGNRRTIQGLEVVKVDPERNLLLVKGSVPGAKGSLVMIRETVKQG